MSTFGAIRVSRLAACAWACALIAPTAAAAASNGPGGAAYSAPVPARTSAPRAAGGAPYSARRAPAQAARPRRSPAQEPRRRRTAPPITAITRPQWLSGVTVTQYWPVPESWFGGRLVPAPGLPGLYPVDWLYSARGISMQGTGVTDDGRYVHIDSLGAAGWVTIAGAATIIGHGSPPYWRAGAYWRNASGGVTFPLQGGGWSNGAGIGYVSLPDVTFAAGPGQALTYWESIAVDPRLIPLGSWVYLPSYRNGPGHGWFYAQDTGGAIVGRHVDVYRPPPAGPSDPGQTLLDSSVYVLPPTAARPSGAPDATPSSVRRSRRRPGKSTRRPGRGRTRPALT